MGRPRVRRIFPIALSVESAATALDVRSTRQNQAHVKLAWRTNQQLLKVLPRGAGHSAGFLARARQAKTRSTIMPLIEVHLIDKVFNPEQKRQIIQKLTDAMVSIEGENMRGVTWVKISEVASGDWGIGGKPMTTEAVKELAAGRRAA